MEAFTATGRFTTTVGSPRYIEVDTAISPACTYIYIAKDADRAVDMLLTADETTKLIAALAQTLPIAHTVVGPGEMIWTNAGKEHP